MYVFGKKEIEAARRVLESGQLFRYCQDGVTESELLEREWALKFCCKHSLVMSSGTAALICGLAGMEIGPGDEVIVPAYTFMSTALAPLAVGAIPVIAEIDESLTIDPNDVKRLISPRTRAIIPVHMRGLPCNMEAILQIARRHDLLVLEDSCQAIGGQYRGKYLGTLGHAGAFSFNQFKLLTCGEGGGLITDSKEIYDRALILHDSGCAFRDAGFAPNVQLFAGVNFRISDLLSAVLRAQFGRLDSILSALRGEKLIINSELASRVRLNPIHDPEGDCGVVSAMMFETPELASRFVRTLEESGIAAQRPIDSGRHVYSNWQPVLQKRGAHVATRDPFRVSPFVPEYSPEMCPRTLSILKRTVLLWTSATRSREDLMKVIAEVRRALPSQTI